MTVDDFEAQRTTLVCAACGHVGLATRKAGPNVGPVCMACASTAPLPGVQWLRQRVRLRTSITSRERDEV